MFSYDWPGAAAYLLIAAFLALPTIATYDQCIGEQTPRNGYNSANASHLAASEILNDPFPYYFPKQDDTANLFAMPACNGIKLEEATIDQLQEYMSQGRLTSVQLVMCYIEREYQTRDYIKYVSSAITPTGHQATLLQENNPLNCIQAPFSN